MLAHSCNQWIQEIVFSSNINNERSKQLSTYTSIVGESSQEDNVRNGNDANELKLDASSRIVYA